MVSLVMHIGDGFGIEAIERGKLCIHDINSTCSVNKYSLRTLLPAIILGNSRKYNTKCFTP